MCVCVYDVCVCVSILGGIIVFVIVIVVIVVVDFVDVDDLRSFESIQMPVIECECHNSFRSLLCSSCRFRQSFLTSL